MTPESTLCIFRLRHAKADHVFLVGSFNNWSTTAIPMSRIEPGRWETSVRLEPGEHRYCYVSIVGSPCGDPSSRSIHIEIVDRISILRVPCPESTLSWN